MIQNRLLSLVLSVPLCVGCLAERSHERDPRLATEVTRQERWAQDAIAGRATPEDLEKIRGGDQETIKLGSRQLRKLTSSVDRGTWIREAAVDSLREDGDDPGLSADFAKAGQTRNEALQAADELALALAEARGGLNLTDLRKALESARRARDSEAKLSRELGAAAAAQPKAPAAGKPAALGPLAHLATVALPVPRPFIAATARYLFSHPEEKLSGFSPDDATEIRAALAELESHPPPEMKPSRSSESRVESAAPNASPRAEAAPNASPRAEAAPNASPHAEAAPNASPRAEPPEPQRGAGPSTLNVAGDAQKLLARRGPPRSISARADGLFALRYQESRSCGVDTCQSDVDYLFDAAGKLVREESTPRR